MFIFNLISWYFNSFLFSSLLWFWLFSLYRSCCKLSQMPGCTAVHNRSKAQSIAVGHPQDMGEMSFSPLPKVNEKCNLRLEEAVRHEMSWTLHSKESKCACASLSHSTGHRDLLAGSPVQEACISFRVVNELWLLLYFSASNSPFCRIFLLLLEVKIGRQNQKHLS